MDKEKEKNGSGNKQTTLELWNHIKWSNIHRSVAPEEVEREWDRRNITRKHGWKFPRNNEGNQITDSKDSKNPKENTNTHIPENTQTNTLRHTKVKLKFMNRLRKETHITQNKQD